MHFFKFHGCSIILFLYDPGESVYSIGVLKRYVRSKEVTAALLTAESPTRTTTTTGMNMQFSLLHSIFIIIVELLQQLRFAFDKLHGSSALDESQSC